MAEDAATTQDEPKARPNRRPNANQKPRVNPRPRPNRRPSANQSQGEPKAQRTRAPAKPADPRLKVLKRFYGKFLPKGVLRDRQKAIMDRWNSGEDHGGVTVEELKALLDDWLGTREKPPRKPKA